MVYFDYLVNLHEHMFENKGYGVRPSCKNKLVIHNLIKEVMNKKYLELDELISDLLKVAAMIVLYQPFYDGNYRTALEMMKQILYRNGYDFCYLLNMEEILRPNSLIPLVYDENFTVGCEAIEKASKYITKVDVKSNRKIRSKKMIFFAG